MLLEINKQVINKGFQLGGLVDLSRFAPTGCSKRVVASATLWRSILWAYPTAQKSDFIDPLEFIHDLHRHCSSPFAHADGLPTLFTYVPRHTPAWLPRDFTISVYDHPLALLVSLKDEPLSRMFQDCHFVPAGLILKLTRLLNRLSHVARHNDRPPLQKLHDHAENLHKNHPLERQLVAARRSHTNSFPGDLTCDEYRALLIEELGLLLEIFCACGLSAEDCALLATQYDKLCSPVNELAHLVRSLIQFAAAVPASSEQLSPFVDLIVAYGSVRKLMDQPNSTPPKKLFEQLRNHTVVLSQLLPRECAEDLSRFQHKLAVLQSFAPTFWLGCTYPPKFNVYH